MKNRFTKLLNTSLDELREEASEICHRLHGDEVSYVVNRNANFTNICNVGCAFCGFQRKESNPDAYRKSPEEILSRLQETPWITEVCLQGGIDPRMDLGDYIKMISSIREALPQIHIHAFSPMEIHSIAKKEDTHYSYVLASLKEAGLNTIPGTAAEILDDQVRKVISQNKLTCAQWEEIIKTAHRLGIPSTATIMFGHVEEWHHIQAHLETLLKIQSETGGFTEFVPLAFVPYQNRLGQKIVNSHYKGLETFEKETLEKAQRLYPLSRIFLGDSIPNLQTSWVKLGPGLAAESLSWGCNDFGGTLYEESITRESGGQHGECLEPEEMDRLILSVRKVPIQRNTLYKTQKSTLETNPPSQTHGALESV